jgi:hypothetical protein
MPDLTAKRTLVKSPPELWEELSEVERLTKHLGAFGDITITKLEPEHTVAWEGEHASGTVSIEPSGWGTKVTLHAELPQGAEPELEPEPEPEPQPEPPPERIEEPMVEEPAAEEPVAEQSTADEPVAGAPVAEEPMAEEPMAEERPRRGFWGWLFRTRTAGPARPPESEPEPIASEPEPIAEQPEPIAPEPEPIAEQPEPIAPEPEPVAEQPEPVAEQPEPVAPEPEQPRPVEPEPEQPEPLEPEPEQPEPAADGEDAPIDPDRARVILDEALDALGAAHHRPFSRG